jgi:hypothetical protein
MDRSALCFFLLLGCSDYEINQTKESVVVGEEEEEALLPSLQVDPLSISEEGICGTSEHEVLLTNAGEAPLTVSSIELSATGWTSTGYSTPLELQPGESQTISLTASAGSGVLSITSDDPADPQILVELSAEADQAPDAAIVSPHNGGILSMGSSLVEGVATDAEDASEALSVSWLSSVDGELGTSVPAPDGFVSMEWPGGSAGDHVLEMSVEDSCGNVTVAQLDVCQQLGYEVDSLDISTWNFEGSAQWDSSGGWVELTSPATGQAGTAFSTAATVSGASVEIEFLFFVSGGSGADGMSITALDTERMDGFVGQSGGGIGYGGLPGWSIEVDTYNNGHDPTPEDHLGFSFNGDNESQEAWAALPDMEDGQWHSMRVEVQDPRVRVLIDGTTYIDQDIVGNFDFPAYIGFTAGTGALTNYHLVDSLVVTEMLCSDD